MPEAPDKPKGDEQGQIAPPFSWNFTRFLLTLGTVFLLLLLTIGGLIYWQSAAVLKDIGETDDRHRMQMVKAQIEQRLSLYNDLVRGYARAQGVQDALLLGDVESAITWSRSVRELLPQTIGAALFTVDGDVIGNPRAQSVGERCVLDLNQRIQFGSAPKLPVHDEVASLAHFDVTAPVRTGSGELLGLVFISFGLDDLFHTLDVISTSEMAAAILDVETGTYIAVSPNWRELSTYPMLSVALAGSQWRVEMRVDRQVMRQRLLHLAWAVTLCVLVLLGLLWQSGTYILRRQRKATQQLQLLMARAQQGELLEAENFESVERFFAGSAGLHTAMMQFAEQYRAFHHGKQGGTQLGFANPCAFEQHLDSLLAQGQHHPVIGGFSLVLLSLDGMQRASEIYGQAIASQLLDALGHALQGNVRETDMVSRWRGNEFAVILPRLNPNQFQLWIRRVRNTFSEKQEAIACCLTEDVRCRISIGHVFVAPGDGRASSILLAEMEGELALYKACRKPKRSAG